MGPRTSPEELQVEEEPRTGPHRGREAEDALVARTDRWLAQAYLSERREPPRVTRDHLPQPLHSSARRLEEGTAGASPAHSRHEAFTALHAEDRNSRSDR